ncbi:MAG: L-threonine 3-dehydrogenase [Candidatus Marinimicrobia bacterium]|jgi:threonine 3-dehydrogenase|nr:L-threonine 3-dehydrogenase [Candidatus Neomarinimicrobiota bacterium]MBT3495718.1 L-threonine 3-dehydrogenase [Candidatus Neomarinimicrobiota bacterium]MBT3692473.1 L-threonine 3-dehydrogenase [Candidatus Neomarinimicrobiota bacterium]MBT3731681.1 L-threonine 3-dehydrogenase [Candidatus Neomarinimicrobiota bacterium]MBT4144510.1 L-threonine 3-dehydrogenase [Candidatus Neomarinimicrobiota bacterium]
MKALVKKSPERGIWMESVPVPICKTNDVKIKITHTAICGTDLHIYKWDEWSQRNIKPPLVTGHEFCGIVEEIGAGVTHFKIGDRVSGEGHITCGYCRNCRAGKRHLCHKTIGIGIHRDGAFSEYLVMPESNVWPIHPEIPSEIAAFFDPFGNATHTALSYEMVGEDVLITGAGPIGIMAVAICNFVGARHVAITDVNDYRLALAKKMGASLTLNVKKDKIEDAITNLGMSNGFDVGLEMSGNPQAFKSMLKNMYHGGRIALLGLLPKSTQINWDDIIFKGLHVKGIYGREMFETWYKMTQMLRSGLDISPVLTHTFPIDDFQKGFDIMESGDCGKVVLEWGDE